MVQDTAGKAVSFKESSAKIIEIEVNTQVEVEEEWAEEASVDVDENKENITVETEKFKMNEVEKEKAEEASVVVDENKEEVAA